MKIFLCSTCFDLEDIRALIVKTFSKKHTFIHSEDAAFPSRRGLHSHDQCIEAVKQADVVLCIIDRRYGDKYRGMRDKNLPDIELTVRDGDRNPVKVVISSNDLSISWRELITAYDEEIHVITFARQRTLDEKSTRRNNQENVGFKPAHVDNIRVFDLLDWITEKKKDNWIIPFHTAVDFMEKLEKWLAVADDSIVPAGVKEGNCARRPITVIVEGKTDAQIVKAVVSKLELQTTISLVVAGGKRPLLSALKVYARAFKESTGIIVLADADTSDPAEIDVQRSQLRQILEDSERPDTRVVLAVPEIESWFGKTDFKRGRIRHFNKLFEELHALQTSLEQRARAVPSLAEFINALRTLDA